MDRYDVVALLGLMIAAIGCGLAYIPLGLIVFGVGLIGGAMIGARGSPLTASPHKQGEEK